jgi:RNA polymerase sigma factor (sigma-70 family)
VGEQTPGGEKSEEWGASFVRGSSLWAVAETKEPRSGRDLTRGLIERIVSGERGAKLRSQVVSWHPGVSREEIDEAFQEACLLAGWGCRGQTEGEVYAWLRTTTHRELGHMRRRSRSRAQRELLVDVTAPEFGLAAVEERRPEDALFEQEDQAELEQVTHSVLARLSERQREIVVLYSHGQRRSEIAEHLGVTPRSVKRALERILAEGRDELLRRAGRGCESGESLVARLAFGLASSRETRQAQLHLASCPRCGALYERLDCWREKVAALFPVPAIAEQAHPGVLERALHGTADALSSIRHRASDGVGAAREQVADATAHAKQQAVEAYYRVVDPTPLAGVRPGAVAAAVAGCLAIGGGATYCVEQGFSPMRAFSGVMATKGHEPKPAEKPRKASAAAAPVVTVTATPTPPPPTATVTPSPQPTAAPTVTAEPDVTPEPPPAPQEEFEPASPVTATQAAQPSSTPSKPAPAPASGPGEFDGP